MLSAGLRSNVPAPSAAFMVVLRHLSWTKYPSGSLALTSGLLAGATVKQRSDGIEIITVLEDRDFPIDT
jgi:hypothetical protein